MRISEIVDLKFYGNYSPMCFLQPLILKTFKSLNDNYISYIVTFSAICVAISRITCPNNPLCRIVSSPYYRKRQDVCTHQYLAVKLQA